MGRAFRGGLPRLSTCKRREQDAGRHPPSAGTDHHDGPGRYPDPGFALFRASLEGLDESTPHAHYGVPGTDVRVTRRTRRRSRASADASYPSIRRAMRTRCRRIRRPDGVPFRRYGGAAKEIMKRHTR
ncbi:hypothetical protein DF048_35160 [Burkholderia seminalis]|nr:hypothetical protein DF048_35160 [Burkholderia seminalis]